MKKNIPIVICLLATIVLYAQTPDQEKQAPEKKAGGNEITWHAEGGTPHAPLCMNSGSSFAYAFLTTQNGTVPPATTQPLVETPKYKFHEFRATGKTAVKNPYQDAVLVGEFTSPSGKTTIVDGFYDGAENWKLRFAPDEEGIWTYLLRGEGVQILQSGELRCTAAQGHGIIRQHPEYPYAFAYADKVPFFPMGDTNYGLLDDSPITTALQTAYLKKRRMQQFNFVRMEVGHSQARAQADPAYWAWGGDPQHPDLDRLNPDFFRKLDSLLLQMRDLGMNAELILLNFYRLPFTDTRQWTPERERLWLRYLLARYAAFDNIFMWTISNEYETHPDGVYHLDTVKDVNWVRQTARFIKANDPYLHLTTVHPVVSSSTSGSSPRSPFEHPWRIGGFYGTEASLDVLSQQTGQGGKGIVWNDTLQCWQGDDPELSASILADRVYEKPVINTENGYEFLRGYPTMRQQGHHTDKVRHSSWRIACAGGYFAAGFSGTIGHSDIWNRIDSPNHYTFSLKDEGAGAQLGYLYRFFTALPFQKMQPYNGITGNAIALSAAGNLFVIYMPQGGTTTLNRTDTGKLRGRWFNPRTGKFDKSISVPENKRSSFTAPDNNDWVLLLKKCRKYSRVNIYRYGPLARTVPQSKRIIYYHPLKIKLS